MTVRRSLGITAVTRVAVLAMSFGTVVIVSRLLTPQEIGIFSVTVALVSLGHVFRDFGVGHFLIQTPEVTSQRRRAAFTVTLGFSWTIAALLLALHGWAARFYGDERVGHVLQLLVANFLVLPFGAPLRTLLQREMQFGKLAAVNLTNHAVQSTVTIGAALAGASYMSMAWGSIAGNLANVLVLTAISPKGALDWPTRHGLGEVLRFGSKVSAASFANAAGAAAPDLVLGRTLGFADVAFYSRAKGLIGMALDQLMYVVNSVYTPAFSRGVREGRNPAELYAQTVGMLLGLTVPLISVLAVLAPTLISWLFGAQWDRSGLLGSLFCLFALATAPFVLAGTSLVSVGHVGVMMRSRLLIEGARIATLFSSLALQLEAVVALLGLVYVVEAGLFLWALKQCVGLQVARLLQSIWRSYALGLLVAAGPLLLVIAAARGWAPLPAVPVLLGSMVLASLCWVAGLALLDHPLKAEVWTLARRLRSARPRP